MTNTEAEQIRQWRDNWKRASKTLEELRIKDIRETDVIDAIPAFDDAFESALWLTPNSPTSGLVELQKRFARMRK